MIEIIAELGINHSGNLEVAKKLIDIACAAGVDYIKFQKRDVDLVYTKEELDKPRESPWGTTTRQQKEGLEFGKREYDEIEQYCAEKDIAWFASVWDINSADFILDKYYSPCLLKIPSALITNLELIEFCTTHPKARPIILSTGMSTFEMIDKAVDVIGVGNVYCIMACTATYPTDPNEINIEFISALKERYPWSKIGFSNHYPGLMAMTLAAAYGAEVIELHLTLDRTMYGSDQAASIEPQGVFKLMEYIKLIEQMKGDGVKRIYDSEIPIIAKLRR